MKLKITFSHESLPYTITGCGKMIGDTSVADKEPRDMDWFYKHNGYAIMEVKDTSNQPVMEIVAIPLNSEAILPLVHKDISDILYYFKKRIEQQHPVFHLTVYAYRDCCFLWPSLMLEQGQGRVYPTSVLSLDVPGGSSEVGSARTLIAAASELFARYGERKVRQADHMVGLFTNPYTGRNMLELDAEIEMIKGETLSAIAIFGGGLKLDQPLRLTTKSRRFVLSNGNVYTTYESSKPMKLYIPDGQKLPGENIYKYDQDKYGSQQGRLRQRDIENQQ